MQRKVEDRIYKAFNRALKDMAREYRKKLLSHRPHPKKATGSLADDIGTGVTMTDSEVTGSLYLQDYWRYVEDGRRKGAKQPPVSAIREWIEQRKIKPWKGQTRKGLAYVMARSIAKKGIPPTHYLQRTVESVTDRHRERLMNAGAEALLEVLDDYFKENELL